jgi:hypothetical protein
MLYGEEYPLLPEDPRHASVGLYEPLCRFIEHEYRRREGILFAEEEEEEEESAPQSNEQNVYCKDETSHPELKDTSRYVALVPHAFLYLLSSYLWEVNLRNLEQKTRQISFQDPRELASRDTASINNDLTLFRKNLDFLTREVADAIARAPMSLETYYNTFPQIRWANPASHTSPLDQLANILVRAKGLEKLLIDSFQMLQATVSVQQATLSNQVASASAEQSRAATRITALAFVYIPLTFVTGIFGMNIRTGAEAPNGFIWYAPLVTLGVAILFTVALWYVADWVESRLAAQRGKRKSDVEGGHSAKAKVE